MLRWAFGICLTHNVQNATNDGSHAKRRMLMQNATQYDVNCFVEIPEVDTGESEYKC
jgi:hypothetical protein